VLWYRDFGLTELILGLAFILFYVLYLVRVIYIGRRLKTSYSNVFIKLIFRTLYFALFLIALLGPSFSGAKKRYGLWEKTS
jgi:Ca-activated chloride channel family protein